MLRTAFLLTLLLLPAAGPALTAQSADTAAVMAPIHRLFDGMRAADSALVRSAFHPGARFVQVEGRGDSVRVVYSDIERFVAAVGGAQAVWDERLFNTVVQVDGPVASVWTDYTFHLGDRFSHCGIDSFELVRAATGWVITQLADTRRREGCPGQGG